MSKFLISAIVLSVLLVSAAQAQWLDTTLYLRWIYSRPKALVYNSVNNSVYCANWNDNSVTVIHGASNQVDTTVGVGDSPEALCYNPQENKVYCATGAGVTVIDGASNQVDTTVAVGFYFYPRALCYNPQNDRVYCANWGGSVTVIDGASNQVDTTIGVSIYARALCYNPRNNKVYCAHYNNPGTVTVIDGASNQVITTVDVGLEPVALCYNPQANTVYCADCGGNFVTVIDGASNQVIAEPGYEPGARALCYNPQDNKVYCANSGGNSVTVFDAASNQVVTTLAAGSVPWDLCYDPQGNKVYCTNSGDSTVTVIDGASDSVVKTIAVGSWPWALTCNPVQNRIYVANFASGSVSIFRDSAPGRLWGWTQMTGLLPGAKGKTVKDGGALAYGYDPSDTGYVYAFKGNNTYEFYRYNTITGVWVAKESIPARNRLGKKKGVKKGSSLAYGTDGKVYATKGNNTLDWWRHDPLTGVWTQKADVPPGAKNCKEGTSLAAVKVGSDNYVYLLRGSGTYDFYRYNTATDAWDITLPTAPCGVSTKAYKNGSSITFDGNDTIYCLKGSYNEFAAYSVAGKTWVTRDPLPLVAPPGTKKKKVKDGSQIASDLDRSVYALKGGNTDEFWMFSTTDQTWHVQTQLTAGSKKVKGGGALVYADNCECLYAFRGNNTLEFWVYPLLQADGLAAGANGESRSIQGQSLVRSPQFALTVAPNPLTGRASISYSLPRAGNVSFRLYDVSGQLVTTLVRGYTLAGSHSALLNADKLARGIYVLRYESGSCTTTSKVIIE